MKILFNVIFILFLFINSVHSEEETTTKQFDDWQLLCVKVEKKERCEINPVSYTHLTLPTILLV